MAHRVTGWRREKGPSKWGGKTQIQLHLGFGGFCWGPSTLLQDPSDLEFICRVTTRVGAALGPAPF